VKNILIIGLVLFGFACNNNSTGNYITVSVSQVEQVESYTYLLVKEKKGEEYWIAVTPISAQPGDEYKYTGGLVMEDFFSAQLNRTFDRIIFLDEIQSLTGSMADNIKEITPGSAVIEEKSNVQIERTEGTTTIKELFMDPEAYAGKIVQLKGEVTKFNASIMERNWIHIQDGTEFEGKYDLTVTSSESFEVGSVVLIEGVLALNQDFGYGYSYEILLEKATAIR
jgi:hypothetical protein